MLLILGLLTRFFNIGYQSIWIDEGSTFFFHDFTLSQLMEYEEPNSPIYYLMEGFLLDVLGQTEFGIRFTSALAGALTVPLAYMVSMRIFKSRPAALMTAVLFLLSPICLFYGQEARGYIIVSMLFLVQILVLLKALESGKNIHWLIFALVSAVQFAMQYSGMIATFTLYLCALYHCIRNGVSKDRYRQPIQMLWSGLLFLLLVSPILYKFVKEKIIESTGYNQWGWCFMGPEYTINQLNDFLFGIPFSYILIIVVAVSLYFCFKRNRDNAVMLSIVMFFPLVFATVLTYFMNIAPRYVLWSAAGFYLTIPYFMTCIDEKAVLSRKGLITMAVVIIILAVSVLPIYYTKVTKDDFRTGAEVLSENARPGDLILYAIGSPNPVYASTSFYYDPISEGIETKGVSSNEELWAITDTGAYANIYILILADYDPEEYLLHVDSPNCELICDAYRIDVFKITGPLPH